ncbi:hypothetical protein [Parabacteroides merdae]
MEQNNREPSLSIRCRKDYPGGQFINACFGSTWRMSLSCIFTLPYRVA